MTKTNLKCVEVVRKIRDGLYLETKSMTDNELIEFYSKKSKQAENKRIKTTKAA